MTADYSQIEMRIMAHLSEDAGLIEAFHSGEDLHSDPRRGSSGSSRDEVDAGDARQDQGDELWPRLWPVRVRAVQQLNIEPPKPRA